MEPRDIQLLNEMRQAIAVFRSDDVKVGDLAHRLLALRDLLQFNDKEWEHELTQHIATLDSASTFVPLDDEQDRQFRSAIATATDSLLSLIETKLK